MIERLLRLTRLAMRLVVLVPMTAMGQIALPLVNAGFEEGSLAAIPAGWTVAAGSNPFWIGDSSYGGSDPADGYHSDRFISASWQYGGLSNADSLIGGQANSALVYQDIDLSPFSSQIASGSNYLGLSYAFFDGDGADQGTISYDFLDSGGTVIGNAHSSVTTDGGGWNFVENLTSSIIPTSASKVRVSLGAVRNSNIGSARNVAFDAISASLQPAPPPEEIGDLVHGNLIQIDGDGNWTWYTDERAVVDPNNGRVLVNSVGFSPSYINPSYTGVVDVVDFDPATGRRVRTQLSNLPGGRNIQSDDHNVGALLVLPDGRYLAMYANHGNNGGLGDEFTRYRVSLHPGDSTSWTDEQHYNWYDEVPGANTTGNPDQANVSYHNLFYLSDEDKVYDISRSYGRLSTNGAGQNMPNIVEFDPDTNTLEWKGQFLESEAQGYSAYPKYVSDGKSRIYFTTTETHPRNYNNSLYAGYIEGGQTFDMAGTLIDPNLFDSNVTAGNGSVPDVTDFTLVAAPDALGEGYNRFWTTDAALDSEGNLMALYTSRYNPDGATSSGTTTNPIDHRLHFARWNPTTETWTNEEIARMGDRLFDSEQDYTGLGALIPGDENTLYISTDFDPRDPNWQTQTDKREIYRGKHDGAQWNWVAITEKSTVDNLRPIAPDTQGVGPQPIFWFRGDYFHAQNADTAVVGIIDQPDNLLPRPVTYVDATATNTGRADDSPLNATQPNASTGLLDGQWHERTGLGNGGSVYTSSETGFEDAPMLRTQIEGLSSGVYDIFAYFWSDNDEDWRLMAGLEENNLVDFRKFGSQHAAEEQFAEAATVTANNNDLLLYRAYVGRTTIVGGEPVNVYVDDWQSLAGGAIRTWYDGVGYSLVAPLLSGDYNEDGVVNLADYTVWRDNLGATELNAFALADGNGDGTVTHDDYEVWRAHFGTSLENPNTSNALGDSKVPEPQSVILIAVTTTLLLLQRGRPARSQHV
ncbi:BNR-4 repeat-containing protein [Aeoliella sp. SH292]|uniref:BNR-4 repeat-containing protein n=1 Tax=Aeoliella sp. SH292 TaxID=3454464 RepID=UPI003F943C72